MVRGDKVVINGLRYADDTKCVTALLSELGNLVRGVLRVVAASVKSNEYCALRRLRGRVQSRLAF